MPSKMCSKCGKVMDEKNFYTHKDGTKPAMCKKCLTMHIDNFDPSTFLWVLEEMDVPYVDTEWNSLRDKAFAKDPRKMNGMSVIGKYLSKMKLKQQKDYGQADTERIRAEREELARQAEVDEQRIAEMAMAANDITTKTTNEELQEKFEQGYITEAQYKTLASTTYQNERYEAAPPPVDLVGADNFYRENDFMSEEQMVDLGADLTEEDKIYLAMKWGRLYKPHEQIELEKKYTEMQDSFCIKDPDTLNSLIILCKTYLKMNQAIDCSDMESYQKLVKAYNDLRKSMKLTAAQKKENEKDFIDSVGELVAYCEREGGQIPKYELTTDYDIVDKVIKDLKEYNKSLIYEDTALARQIEDYIKQRNIQNEMKEDKRRAQEQGREAFELSDKDYQARFEQLEQERAANAQIEQGEIE